MTSNEHWIIAPCKHELGYPIGETLFRGTKEEAILHTLEMGNEGARIVKARRFLDKFIAVIEESCV